MDQIRSKLYVETAMVLAVVADWVDGWPFASWSFTLRRWSLGFTLKAVAISLRLLVRRLGRA